MTFAFPLAFFGLLTVPALVAIYWLRSKHRRQTVSSLMLWSDQRQSREGGLVIHRLQTPLLFFLEVLAIMLLILAAAGPVILARNASGPLVIVLDDSYSMRAGGENSPRTRAGAAVEDELRGGRYSSARIVLAGETPSLAGEASSNADQSLALLDRWTCFEPAANLEDAVAFAFGLGGNRARVLVVTDHAPAEAPSDGRLQWRAFGKSGSNLAFVNATRTARDGDQRCLLEVANLSLGAASARLIIEDGASQELRRYDLGLGPNSSERVILTLKSGAGPLRARLEDDALAVDNQVVLLPQPAKPVRTELRIRNEALRALVEKALRASTNAVLDSTDPQLLLTDDDQGPDSGPETWVVRIAAEQNAESYVGPFVIDRAHPLAEGLSLDGVVWAAGPSPAPGAPIITAGNVPLLTDVERADGRHDLRLRLRPDLSTLQDTPNWPILIWNLLDWRASRTAGLKQSNVHLGSAAALTLPAAVTSVEVQPPDEPSRQVPARERSLMIRAERPGIYEISAGGEKYSFASNALSRQESDLTRCAYGNWGGWDEAAVQELAEHSAAWALLLPALVGLAIHLALAARSGRL